jgi:hypothetical protein
VRLSLWDAILFAIVNKALDFYLYFLCRDLDRLYFLVGANQQGIAAIFCVPLPPAVSVGVSRNDQVNIAFAKEGRP